MYHSKASKLLRELREAVNVKWDIEQLVIDGALVQGDIVNLVNDAMGSRKGNPPRGHRQFAAALPTACIPFEYIGNQRVKLIVGASSPSKFSKTRRSFVEQHQSDREDKVVRSPDITSTPKSDKTRKNESRSGGGG